MTAPPRLNMDFSVPVSVPPSAQEWVTSPADGVSRVHLERVAPESGHTTSLVSFAPGPYFPEHDHPQGEEIFVLKGTFSDECGDYPTGSYLRNPPGSKHSHLSKHFPCVEEEKLILVKTGHLPEV